VRRASLALALVSSVVGIACVSCSSEPTPITKPSTKTASFKTDIVPIVQESCALTACHSSKESNLGIFLAFDAAQIYGELKKTSPTAAGEKFVVPGDPAKSYLIVKLEGKQSVGTEMPPGEKLPLAQIELFKKWIADGAKDN
jgi:hypothetical protein